MLVFVERTSATTSAAATATTRGYNVHIVYVNRKDRWHHLFFRLRFLVPFLFLFCVTHFYSLEHTFNTICNPLLFYHLREYIYIYVCVVVVVLNVAPSDRKRGMTHKNRNREETENRKKGGRKKGKHRKRDREKEKENSE